MKHFLSIYLKLIRIINSPSFDERIINLRILILTVLNDTILHCEYTKRWKIAPKTWISVEKWFRKSGVSVEKLALKNANFRSKLISKNVNFSWKNVFEKKWIPIERLLLRERELLRKFPSNYNWKIASKRTWISRKQQTPAERTLITMLDVSPMTVQILPTNIYCVFFCVFCFPFCGFSFSSTKMEIQQFFAEIVWLVLSGCLFLL